MKFSPFLLAVLFCFTVTAQEAKKEVQDMSDPLAVYTQGGLGATNKGINVKVGKSYDPGSKDTMAMNVIELKGLLGEALGWDRSSKKSNKMDSFRFRNFSVNTKNGRGKQIDMDYKLSSNHLAERSGNISYAIIQALPKMSIFNLYPLAGLGMAFGKNAKELDGSVNSGFSVNGVNLVIGMYGKIGITKKIWLNYNPIWTAALGGSNNYENHAFGPNQSHILLHEFAASYQVSSILNVRYFANWNEKVDFTDGDHRLEFNYQF